MAFRTYKIPRIRVDLDNIFAGYKAENVHIYVLCLVLLIPISTAFAYD